MKKKVAASSQHQAPEVGGRYKGDNVGVVKTRWGWLILGSAILKHDERGRKG